MKDNNIVSVVIPVYNAENYVKRCLDSVLNQTYSNLEIILIDDGSTDNSWGILKDYQNKYPNVIKIFKQENMGVSKTRNKGIQIATGKYLMFMDNDDYLEKEYIEKFVCEIVKNDYDVVIGGFQRPNSEGKIVEKVILDMSSEYSKFKIVAAWAKIYKLDYIKNNGITFLDSNIGEDIYFTIQAVLMTNKIKIIDYVGYNWFYNELSVSNTAHKNLHNDLQFDYLLDKLYTKLYGANYCDNEYVEYYFIKLIVWFMLYSTKGVEFSLISSTLKKNFDWLKYHFPNYKNNKLVRITNPKGEILINRIIVWMFVKGYDYGIIKLMLFIYSKVK